MYESLANYRYENQAHYRILHYQTEAYKFRPIEYREKIPMPALLDSI
jgi:hypothetical protein